jgi:hypothetical protein
MEFGSTVALLFANWAVSSANSALPDADIAHVIQLAVAPVFLLSGVGVMLTVFTSRLARIVDRSRVLVLATLTGLFVCVVIAALFVSLAGLQRTGMVSVPFVLAMLAFAVAFSLFLLEVLSGTAYLSRSRPRLSRKAAPPSPRALDHEINRI